MSLLCVNVSIPRGRLLLPLTDVSRPVQFRQQQPNNRTSRPSRKLMQFTAMTKAMTELSAAVRQSQTASQGACIDPGAIKTHYGCRFPS
jgi:hypothetical protein